MRIAPSALGYRADLASGLLLLGLLGIWLTVLFLGLDDANAAPLSKSELGLLALSVVGVAAGGAVAKSRAAALRHLFGGGLMGFVTLSSYLGVAYFGGPPSHDVPRLTEVLVCSVALSLVAALALVRLRRETRGDVI